MMAEAKAAFWAHARMRDDDPKYKEAERCADRAYDALLAARPTDPAAMAVQLRWLLGEQLDGDNPEDRGILEHIADQLEALAGGVVLQAKAAVQVRDALVAGIEHHGGALESEDEPGLGEDTREFEDTMRSAIKLLDGAGWRARHERLIRRNPRQH